MNVNQVLKIMAYAGLLFVVVYAIASATGNRAAVQRPRPRKLPRANGSVWTRQSVPAAVTQMPAAAVPTIIT